MRCYRKRMFEESGVSPVNNQPLLVLRIAHYPLSSRRPTEMKLLILIYKSKLLLVPPALALLQKLLPLHSMRNDSSFPETCFFFFLCCAVTRAIFFSYLYPCACLPVSIAYCPPPLFSPPLPSPISTPFVFFLSPKKMPKKRTP